jgi:hypothetical protein
MTEVVQLKQYAIDRVKDDLTKAGQATIAVEQLDRFAEQTLKNVLKNIGLHDEMKIIFHAWTNLEAASSRLCGLITMQYPGKTGPLLEEIFRAAYDVYEQSILAREPEVFNMVRYLTVLADSSYAIQRTDVFALNAKDKPENWPFFSQPLQVWAKKIGAKEIYFVPAPEPSIDAIVGGRNYLCAHIMSMNDIGKLELLNHVPGNQNRAV